MAKFLLWWQQQFSDLVAAVIFYTSIPLPYIENLDFQRVACFAPMVGLIIGGILGGLDGGISYIGVPALTRSAVIVAVWLLITGGLHLDGAMDTSDGLAVNNPERRLEVMSDSATGAFGAMSGIIIILLKTVALTDIEVNRWLVLMGVCGWGRWGQQLAIACYPYLKAAGKGAFHKQAIRSYIDVIPSLLLLLCFSVVMWWFNWQNFTLAVMMVGLGLAIASITSAWFNHKLGGHTGDTYGAVVEWSEAILIIVLTCVV
ncbi:adenosylcobinamide-GDP ribazoletransferase [Anabaena sp. FACHB-1237]|uniref:adenosylcobinamide-GDP ribazoletransferase n=1 Tax=Anabaena sp. FACHB-1237 TaxID=2692769 RepID=UPI0016806511|nr:adenosylcobinamide-GDP ribazoletransferase [Anabaena sp. FACHB-1237]MBD2136961.1 adenosylcobinamide-GDP ribazoletransferase [Anabaena sp. FACHB-1237]